MTNPALPPTISGGSGNDGAQDGDDGEGDGAGSPYSPIEHLARIIYPRNEWADTKFAMLTWAFDAGGKEEDQPCVTVGGFVSNAKDWIDFSNLWNARLKRDDLTFFRMSDFATWNGEFSNKGYWIERRRRSLISDLLDILISHAYRRVGCIVTTDAVNLLSTQLKEQWRLNAYVIGARVCCAGARTWNSDAPTEYVFEEGDEREDLIARLKGDGYPRPQFRPKKDIYEGGRIVRYGFVPLQAADILAYEMFKRQTDPEHARSFIRDRLDRVLGPLRLFTVNQAEGLEHELGTFDRASEVADRLSEMLRAKGETP